MAVSFNVSGITPLPRIQKIIKAIKHERNAWLWQHGDSSSLGIIHVGIDKAGKDDAQRCPGIMPLIDPPLCSLSSLLPLLHEMNKELSFLSAAAIFNQWINVSTFVGIRIGNL